MISESDIPDGWNIKSIKDVGEVITGGTPRRSNESYYGGDIPWLRISDLNGLYVKDSDEYITEKGLNESSATLLNKGSVILSTRATIGEVAIAEEKVSTNQGFKSIDINENIITSRYLAYLLIYYRDYLNSLGRGATYPEITKSQLCDVKIPVPPLDEQERIVSYIERELNWVEELEKSTSLLREYFTEYKKSLLNTVFSGEKNMDEPTPVEITNESIPEGWELSKFDDVIHSSFYGCNPTKGEDIDGVPYLRISDITKEGKLKHSSLPKKAELDESDAEKYKLSYGDVVVARSGSVGQSYVYKKSDEQMVYASYLIRFELDLKLVLPEYIEMYFQSPMYWSQVYRNKRVSAQPNINAGEIKNFVVPIPPLEEQKKIIDDIKSEYDFVNKGLKTINQFEKYSEEYKESVLSSAFKGNIDY